MFCGWMLRSIPVVLNRNCIEDIGKLFHEIATGEQLHHLHNLKLESNSAAEESADEAEGKSWKAIIENIILKLYFEL